MTSINVIGLRPIGYTFTSLRVAIMSPLISLVSAQYASDCMRKPLEIINFPGGGPLDALTAIFFQMLTPPPLSEKLDLPLQA